MQPARVLIFPHPFIAHRSKQGVALKQTPQAQKNFIFVWPAIAAAGREPGRLGGDSG
jgi:hypothetical protein